MDFPVKAPKTGRPGPPACTVRWCRQCPGLRRPAEPGAGRIVNEVAYSLQPGKAGEGEGALFIIRVHPHGSGVDQNGGVSMLVQILVVVRSASGDHHRLGPKLVKHGLHRHRGPPEPRIRAFFPAQLIPIRRMVSEKPQASVLSPYRLPSGRRTRVLTPPRERARGRAGHSRLQRLFYKGWSHSARPNRLFAERSPAPPVPVHRAGIHMRPAGREWLGSNYGPASGPEVHSAVWGQGREECDGADTPGSG